MTHFPTLREYGVKFMDVFELIWAVCKQTQNLLIPWEYAVACSVKKTAWQYHNTKSTAIP